LAERILKAHHDKVAYVMLVPSSGGVHEVRFGGQILHSKAETKRHPDPRDVLEKIKNAPAEV